MRPSITRGCIVTIPLSPTIHIQILQTELHTFLLRIVEIKVFFLWQSIADVVGRKLMLVTLGS